MEKKLSRTHYNSLKSTLKMKMVYMKEKYVMVGNMAQENITTKMEISMKDKCIKESCKGRENISGLIKMYMKAPSFKIR